MSWASSRERTSDWRPLRTEAEPRRSYLLGNMAIMAAIRIK